MRHWQLAEYNLVGSWFGSRAGIASASRSRLEPVFGFERAEINSTVELPAQRQLLALIESTDCRLSIVLLMLDAESARSARPPSSRSGLPALRPAGAPATPWPCERGRHRRPERRSPAAANRRSRASGAPGPTACSGSSPALPGRGDRAGAREQRDRSGLPFRPLSPASSALGGGHRPSRAYRPQRPCWCGSGKKVPRVVVNP